MSTVTDRARRELHQRAEATWGQDAADTLMTFLPPTGWADVATKSDITSETAILRAEMMAMEARLVARMQEKLTEVHEKIAEVHEKIAEIHQAIAGVHAVIGAQARWFVIALSGTVIAVSALPRVVERLLP